MALSCYAGAPPDAFVQCVFARIEGDWVLDCDAVCTERSHLADLKAQIKCLHASVYDVCLTEYTDGVVPLPDV